MKRFIRKLGITIGFTLAIYSILIGGYILVNNYFIEENAVKEQKKIEAEKKKSTDDYLKYREEENKKLPHLELKMSHPNQNR